MFPGAPEPSSLKFEEELLNVCPSKREELYSPRHILNPQGLPRPSHVVPPLVVLIRVLTKKDITNPKTELHCRVQVKPKALNPKHGIQGASNDKVYQVCSPNEGAYPLFHVLLGRVGPWGLSSFVSGLGFGGWGVGFRLRV